MNFCLFFLHCTSASTRALLSAWWRGNVQSQTNNSDSKNVDFPVFQTSSVALSEAPYNQCTSTSNNSDHFPYWLLGFSDKFRSYLLVVGRFTASRALSLTMSIGKVIALWWYHPSCWSFLCLWQQQLASWRHTCHYQLPRFLLFISASQGADCLKMDKFFITFTRCLIAALQQQCIEEIWLLL